MTERDETIGKLLPGRDRPVDIWREYGSKIYPAMPASYKRARFSTQRKA